MCGIAGIVSNLAGPRPLAKIPDVARALQHRGPDDVGFLTLTSDGVTRSRTWQQPEAAPQAVFVFRRLSILDLSESGAQPMSFADGRYWIVYNGEIYNYVELREELRGHGYAFHSTGDTEVLLAAYAHWGTAAFTRLVGMFAFVLLDTLKRCIVLCRDYFGIKPLYFTTDDGALYFASELPALMEFGGNVRQVDAVQLYRYLRYGITDSGSRTMFSRVRQLPAGCFAEIALDSAVTPQPVRYWNLQANQIGDISFDEAAAELRGLFLGNVAMHMRSDVPIGSALSGGIDSSAIVCAMRHLSSDLDLHVFTYVAADPHLNEERWVDIVAKRAGAKVHKTYPQADDLVRDLPRLGIAQGEPFGGTSTYAQYRVFAEAHAAEVKVLLDGQGADELLAGYRVYLGVRLADLVRGGKLREAASFLHRCKGQPGVSSSYVVQKAAEYLLPSEVQGPLRRLVGRELLPAWMNGSWFHDAGVNPVAEAPSLGRPSLKEELTRSLTATSLPLLLRYEDRNSMAWSVESRVPFLTPRLAEFILSLPSSYIIGDEGMSKRVFRAAMRGIVPDEILDRRDKIGFATPEQGWMRELDSWVQQLLNSEVARGIPPLNASTMRHMWERSRDGRQRFDGSLWRALNVIQWTDQFAVTYA